MNGAPTMAELSALIRLTLQSPRQGAAEVLRQNLGRDALWLMLGLVLVLTTMTSEFGRLVIGQSNLSLVDTVLLQAVIFVLMIMALHHVGRYFGGEGSFEGALALVCWLQFIFVVIQVVQVLAFAIMPPASVMIAVFSVGLFFWLVVHFTMELHGFTSIGSVFAGVLGTMVLLAIVLWFFAGLLGIELQTGQVE